VVIAAVDGFRIDPPTDRERELFDQVVDDQARFPGLRGSLRGVVLEATESLPVYLAGHRGGPDYSFDAVHRDRALDIGAWLWWECVQGKGIYDQTVEQLRVALARALAPEEDTA
jgi:hypothetical protein